MDECDLTPDWEEWPAAGWEEYVDARRRALARLRGEPLDGPGAAIQLGRADALVPDLEQGAAPWA